MQRRASAAPVLRAHHVNGHHTANGGKNAVQARTRDSRGIDRDTLRIAVSLATESQMTSGWQREVI